MDPVQVDGNVGVYESNLGLQDAVLEKQPPSPENPQELTKEEKAAVSWWKNPIQGWSEYIAGLYYGIDSVKRDAEQGNPEAQCTL